MNAVQDLAPTPAEYLTVRELAALLRYTGKHAPKTARKWLERTGVRRHYRSGRVALVKRTDVDRVLAGGAP